MQLVCTTGRSTGGVGARAANARDNDCNPDGRIRGTRCVAKQDGGRSAVPVVRNLLDFRKRFDEDFKSIGDLIEAAKIEQAAPFAIRDTAPTTSETIATSEK